MHHLHNSENNDTRHVCLQKSSSSQAKIGTKVSHSTFPAGENSNILHQ